MSITNYIISDPSICHGKPCFKGTRIMVYLVLEMLADKESAADIIKNAYPKLTLKHIEAALHYAASMAKAGHMVEAHAISR
jgi:uncharacterized protein (DUF433 family)